MLKKIQFQSDDERNTIITENNALFLIEEQNITEGNFLIFSDGAPKKEVVYKDVPAGELEQIKTDNMKIMQALAEIYETMFAAQP